MLQRSRLEGAPAFRCGGDFSGQPPRGGVDEVHAWLGNDSPPIYSSVSEKKCPCRRLGCEIEVLNHVALSITHYLTGQRVVLRCVEVRRPSLGTWRTNISLMLAGVLIGGRDRH